MDLVFVAITLIAVVSLYFSRNPMKHSKGYQFRRFLNWFPLGMSYAFLYMGRYNLNVAKNALGDAMSKESFGLIFGLGTFIYAVSLLLNGPVVDKIGGRRGIMIATAGACLANMLMGVTVYLFLNHRLPVNLTGALIALYMLNMFFQSYGAVSIIKVNAYWFHVRERGLFGAIFGTLLSSGIYLAFDWNTSIANAASVTKDSSPVLVSGIQSIFGVGNPGATAMVFFVPAAILICWTVIDYFLICDTPQHAGLPDFDTADASSGEMDVNFTLPQLLKKVLTHPIILMVAAVEFTTGVIRNGILQWYFIFAHDVPQVGAEFFKDHWGFILFITGICGGFAAGIVSDTFFQSRRGPPVALAAGIMIVAGIVMAFTLRSSPIAVGTCGVVLGLLSISIHSMMSGTAAADFGGRKATATASGITDAFVYLGTAVQSVSLGFLTTKNWIFWPIFLIPFAMLGLLLASRMWHSLPKATRDYLSKVEHINLDLPGQKS